MLSWVAAESKLRDVQEQRERRCHGAAGGGASGAATLRAGAAEYTATAWPALLLVSHGPGHTLRAEQGLLVTWSVRLAEGSWDAWVASRSLGSNASPPARAEQGLLGSSPSSDFNWSKRGMWVGVFLFK